jgi:hypothetical protein
MLPLDESATHLSLNRAVATRLQQSRFQKGATAFLTNRII